MPSPTAALPLYVRLTELIEGMIRRRALLPGDRAPSVRQLSREQRVSVPTVLHAYGILESRGLIEARPKSGYFVAARSADSIPEPARPVTLPEISNLAKTDVFDAMLDNYAPDETPFGAALPSPDLLPAAKLSRIMAAMGRRLGPAGASYDFIPGCLPLRREIARRSLAGGCQISPDDVLITLGATEAINLALRATCQPGDTVIIESPTFFGFIRQLRLMQLNALPIPVDSTQGLCLEALERAVRRNRVSACIAVANFHNPVGFAMPDARKREMLRILGRRGIPLIEDDIYGDLQHEGSRPHLLKAFDERGDVLLCGSYSKTLAPGYRTGYLVAGRWQARAIAFKKIQSLANATLPSLAIAEFLRNGGYDRYLRSFRATCRRQVDDMRTAVGDLFPEGTRLSRPQGGFMLWCELPVRVDSLELFRQAAAAGINIAPGPIFSSDGTFRNFMRINCGYPWNAQMERSLGVLAHLVHRLAAAPGSARLSRPGSRPRKAA
jgi:DNA-binding transcriptional MocR family regulator